MRHRLSGLSTYGLNGLCKGDDHPAYTSLTVWHRIVPATSSSDEDPHNVTFRASKQIPSAKTGEGVRKRVL